MQSDHVNLHKQVALIYTRTGSHWPACPLGAEPDKAAYHGGREVLFSCLFEVWGICESSAAGAKFNNSHSEPQKGCSRTSWPTV